MATDNSQYDHLWAAFPNYDAASQGAAAFMDHGVASDEISLIAKNIPTEYELDRERRMKQTADQGITTTTAQDAEVGAEKGLAVGTGVGILAGLAALAIPGVGLVVGGGALAMAIAGAVGTAAGGAVTGAVAGYLKDQGVDSGFTTGLTHRIQNGDVILHVVFDTKKLPGLQASALVSKYGGAEIADPTSVSEARAYLR